MMQNQEVRGIATNIFADGRHTHVQYHATRVVSFSDHEIVLRSGGYYTRTTKLRMTQASNQFCLGFKVIQRDGDWFVLFGGERLDFSEGMTLCRASKLEAVPS